MAQYLNPLQPIRDDSNLMFRTGPKVSQNQGKLYRSCELPNMITQIQLYRWTFSDCFTEQVTIGDLHEYLVGMVSFISKRHLGGAVLNALDYDPRKLKGVTKENDRARMTYVFAGGPLELRYGLEWMICAWYRRFLMSEGTPKGDLDTQDKILMELTLLGTESHEDYVTDVLGPLRRTSVVYEEPNWKELMRAAAMETHDKVEFVMDRPRWASVEHNPKDLVKPDPIEPPF